MNYKRNKHLKGFFSSSSLWLLLVVVTGCTTFGNYSDKGSGSPVDRGRYLVQIMGCNDCHTSDAITPSSYGPEEDWLIGGKRGFYGPYGTVYPTNLRLLVSEISEDEWLNLAKDMRRNSPMAWSRLSHLSDQDMLSVYHYISALGPKGQPAPPRLPPGVIPKSDYISFPMPH